MKTIVTFLLVISLMVMCSCCTANVPDNTNSLSVTGVPTVQEAIHAVIDDCTGTIVIDLSKPRLYLDTYYGWRVTATVYKLEQQQYERRNYTVSTGADGVVAYYTAEPFIIDHADMLNGIAQERYTENRTSVWEAEKGNWYFWTVEDKAAFYDHYGDIPDRAWYQGMTRWLLPSDDEVPFSDAQALVHTMFQERYGVSPDDIVVYENVRYADFANSGPCWYFTYLTQIDINGELEWFEVYSVKQAASGSCSFMETRILRDVDVLGLLFKN